MRSLYWANQLQLPTNGATFNDLLQHGLQFGDFRQRGTTWWLAGSVIVWKDKSWAWRNSQDASSIILTLLIH